MAFFAFVFGNAVTLAIGARSLKEIDRKNRLGGAELLAYGYLLWIAVVGFCLFVTSWAGFWFWFWKYVFAVAAIAAVARTLLKRDFRDFVPKVSSPHFKKSLFLVPLVLAVVFRLFFSAFNTYHVPSYFDDEKGNWNVKAKEIYYAGKIETDDPKSLSYVWGGWHREYPLQFILYKTYLTDIAWDWNEPLANSVTILFWLAVLSIVYVSFGNPAWGTVAVYALCSIPLVSWHVGRAYFDLVVAGYFLLALANIRAYSIGRDSVRLALLWILAYSVVFTKNEWMVLVMPSLSVAFAVYWALSFKGAGGMRPFDYRSLWIPAAAFAFILPHMAFRAAYGLSFNPHSSAAAYGFHSESLDMYWTYFTSWGSFSIFWYVVPVLSILTFRKWTKPQNLPVAAGIATMAAMLFFVFSFTNNFQYLLDQTTINRTLLIVMVPFTYFTILFLDPSTSEKA